MSEDPTADGIAIGLDQAWRAVGAIEQAGDAAQFAAKALDRLGAMRADAMQAAGIVEELTCAEVFEILAEADRGLRAVRLVERRDTGASFEIADGYTAAVFLADSVITGLASLVRTSDGATRAAGRFDDRLRAWRPDPFTAMSVWGFAS